MGQPSWPPSRLQKQPAPASPCGFFLSSRPSERDWSGEASTDTPANDGARRAAAERRPHGQYQNGELPVRDVGGARSGPAVPCHHEAGKVCPGLRTRRGNPPVPRPLSHVHVSAFRNNARRGKVGVRAERKEGRSRKASLPDEGIPCAAALLSLTSSCPLISCRQ